MHDLNYFRSNLDLMAQKLATRGFELDVAAFRDLDAACPEGVDFGALVDLTSARIGLSASVSTKRSCARPS